MKKITIFYIFLACVLNSHGENLKITKSVFKRTLPLDQPGKSNLMFDLKLSLKIERKYAVLSNIIFYTGTVDELVFELQYLKQNVSLKFKIM